MTEKQSRRLVLTLALTVLMTLVTACVVSLAVHDESIGAAAPDGNGALECFKDCCDVYEACYRRCDIMDDECWEYCFGVFSGCLSTCPGAPEFPPDSIK